MPCTGEQTIHANSAKSSQFLKGRLDGIRAVCAFVSGKKLLHSKLLCLK